MCRMAEKCYIVVLKQSNFGDVFCIEGDTLSSLHELKGLEHDGILINPIFHQHCNSRHLQQYQNVWKRMS